MLVRVFSVDETETRYIEGDDTPTIAAGVTPIRCVPSVEGTKLLWEGELQYPPLVEDSVALPDKDVTVVARVFYLPTDDDPAFVALFVAAT